MFEFQLFTKCKMNSKTTEFLGKYVKMQYLCNRLVMPFDKKYPFGYCKKERAFILAMILTKNYL